MEDVCAPTLSLPDAANAAGLDLRYLRDLLAEHRMVLLAMPFRRPGQQYRASIVDALRLRVLKLLRDAGLNDSQAVYTIDLAVDPLLGGICGCGIPLPRSILIGRLFGAAFHVIPDEADEMPDVYSTKSGYPAPDDCAVAITLNLSAILADLLACLPITAAGAAISGNHK